MVKRTCVYSLSAERRRQSVFSIHYSWEPAFKTHHFCVSACVHSDHKRATGIHLRFTSTGKKVSSQIQGGELAASTVLAPLIFTLAVGWGSIVDPVLILIAFTKTY